MLRFALIKQGLHQSKVNMNDYIHVSTETVATFCKISNEYARRQLCYNDILLPNFKHNEMLLENPKWSNKVKSTCWLSDTGRNVEGEPLPFVNTNPHLLIKHRNEFSTSLIFFLAFGTQSTFYLNPVTTGGILTIILNSTDCRMG